MENSIEKSIHAAQALRINQIYNNFSNAAEVSQDEDRLNKGEDDELEKGELLDTLNYDSKIKVVKTGKEIKAQVASTVHPDLEARLTQAETDATDKLGDCGNAPTHPVDPWWTRGIRGIDAGYKIYDWRETYIPTNDNGIGIADSVSTGKQKEVDIPTDQDEATARSQYNDLVRQICDIKVDLKACDIISQLNDKTRYELTPKQVLVFGF
jgi:hypothetical protein